MGQPPSTALACSFNPAFLAPRIQSIVGIAVFVKLALGLPFTTFTTSLFFHTINDPMGLLIAIVFSCALFVLSVIPARALFAIQVQSIFGCTHFGKLAFRFPLFAPAAPFFFYTVNDSMGLLISVVFFFHFSRFRASLHSCSLL